MNESPIKHEGVAKPQRRLSRPAWFTVVVALMCGLGFVLIANRGPTSKTVDAGSSAAKIVDDVTAESDDLTFELSGSNTDIKWTGSNAIGQTPTGYFYELAGTVALDSETQSLKRLELNIDMHGVKAMANTLTKKLKHNGFFEVEKFPESKFISTSIDYTARLGDPPGTNCVIEGNFQLRNITKSIRIPAEIAGNGDAFSLKSSFKISRRDYGVVYSDAAGDKLIRDAVMIEVGIDSKRNSTSLIELEPAVGRLEASMPIENYTETIRPTLVDFDLVLVPGDEAAGIKSFFIGKTEVTWNEFDYWALCKNMQDKESINQISMLLRPSAPHDLEKVYRGWGRERQPVVGVSRKSAELYCEWLTQQTGKTYRLPTAAEWERAYVLGGGELNATQSSEELSQVAWFDENAVSTDEEGFDQERAMPVGELKPNSLGIHDMLGNVAEWVAGDEMAVRGGHFKLSVDELVGSHAEQEDQSVWNKDYPQDPKSIWWYVNADYVGFRVVCELE